MGLKPKHIVLFLIAGFLLIASKSQAQFPNDEKHIEASLRMIGHQLLLNSGDSISRVLPIIREEDRYRIQFESDFEFMPDDLVSIFNRVVYETRIANSFIVEVESCETGEIVYSFKMNKIEQSDIIPCLGRPQPKSCYTVLFTNVASTEITTTTGKLPKEAESNTNTLYYMLFGVLILVLALLVFIFKRNRKSAFIDPNWIQLGRYYFDKRNTELIIEEQRIELTGKEADLLLLLYDSANATVERDLILNKVWGDEGDYIGRTLDVFISKLRKKLEFDSKVKIVNVRGVGYKLILDV